MEGEIIGIEGRIIFLPAIANNIMSVATDLVDSYIVA